jgi:hypothetical protein
MRSLQPEQLVLLLLFVLVPLFNVLLRWLQRRAQERPRPAPAEPRAAEPAAREEWRAPLPPRVRVIEPALPREEPREPRPAPRPRPVVRRAGPLGGPAAVRRAVIAMTILGPCRGLEEPPPDLPRPPAAR